MQGNLEASPARSDEQVSGPVRSPSLGSKSVPTPIWEDDLLIRCLGIDAVLSVIAA